MNATRINFMIINLYDCVTLLYVPQVCSFTNSSLEEKLGPVCDLAILVRGLGRVIKQDENKNIVTKLTGEWSKQSMSAEKLKTIRH